MNFRRMAQFPLNHLGEANHRQSITQCVKENNGITKFFLKDLIKESSLKNAASVSDEKAEHERRNVQKDDKNQPFNVTYTWETDPISGFRFVNVLNKKDKKKLGIQCIYCRDKKLFRFKRSVLYHMVTFDHGLKSSVMEELQLNEKNADERSEFINNFNEEKCAQRRAQSGSENFDRRGIGEEPERKHARKCCNNYELIKLEIEFVATLNLLTCEELKALFCFFFPEKIFSFSECTNKEIIIEHFLQNISSVSTKYSSLIKSAYDEPILNKDTKYVTLQEYLNELKISREAQNSCIDEPNMEGEVVFHDINGKDREGTEGDIGGDGANMGSDAADEMIAIEEILQISGNDEHGALGEREVEPMHKETNVANHVTCNIANERTDEDAANITKRRKTKKPKGLDASTGQLNPKNHILININDCDILKHNDKIFINLSSLREVKADAERKKENDAIIIVSGSGEAGQLSEVGTNKVCTNMVDRNDVDPTIADHTTEDANGNEIAHSAKKGSSERINNSQTSEASAEGGNEKDVNPPLGISINRKAKRSRNKKDTNEKCTTQVGKRVPMGAENCKTQSSQPKKKIKVDDLQGGNSAQTILLSQDEQMKQHLEEGKAQTEECNSKETLLNESSNMNDRHDEEKAKNSNNNRTKEIYLQSSSNNSGTPSSFMDKEKEFNPNDELAHAINVEDKDIHEMDYDTVYVNHSKLGEAHEKNTAPLDQGECIRKVVPLKGVAKMMTPKMINREENVKRKKTKHDDKRNEPKFCKKIKCPTRHNEINKNEETPSNSRKKKGNTLQLPERDKAENNSSLRNSINLKGGKCVSNTGGNRAISCVKKNSIKGKILTKKRTHVGDTSHDGNNHLGEQKSNASLHKQFNSVSVEGNNKRVSEKMLNKQLCNVSMDNIIQPDVMNLSRTRSCRLGRYDMG
ncbi:conserved Plasmodium protein, unknown function [Plasmodium knowlesi strain H]|uniref:Uncharacterized protein n=2 Tax=Plasmodium knowlesi TaxID=5850 RepID=A0A679L7V3_PLAKH|nr:conserved Plasmodium protein, unknown function [Plasmodium knowlesi strain H]OTN63997.1 Uncharacterized protein PKNOH_S140268500 [Plasmodium knowlesi]CAA9991099.1 conserved Plasmodium protein, unknown function [Plasmodium knowlesi strain H]VVS80573.1 conserved Plasmodium protein, unknown function [Plasmodium knowlesi strain H]